MSSKYIERFPKSLRMIGLEPGFTNQQFNAAMTLLRSEDLRKLAHEEWKQEQSEEYDNQNYRWYLSYVSSSNEVNTEFKYMCNNKK